jgi:hypothetical protein
LQMPRNPTREAGSSRNVPDASIDKDPCCFLSTLCKRMQGAECRFRHLQCQLHPEGPTNTTNSPLLISRSTPLMT